MSSKTILIVDDNQADRMFIREAIENVTEKDCQVFEACDGQDLLDILNGPGNGTTPTLIVLDMNMPRKNGLEALEIIKSGTKGQRIPIVMLSNNSDKNLINRAYELGVNHYVRKPSTRDGYAHIANAVNSLFLSPFPF
ncbi:Response regulator rcp1 [Dyadobacter sp. CECT 9275]|uniref:Response regulator rcp1 n=1 Tax=Dyadobacter helix TaxID=2822344 RepID=A0A916N8T8_9BACT|nr:response regulator [Dyadobacter sp. CECT 9275]CAG5018311.1 Response regulator rcp1 [Dyadobacter sp. CECT 9275]